MPRFSPQPATLVPTEVRRTCLTYETFFGLSEKPFSVSSDPRFLYKSRSHATALESLLAGIRRRDGLIVLTGDIGTGKTTLCRAALQNLDPRTLSALVPDPFASREDLLKMLLIDFGVMSVQDLTLGRLKDASRTELSYLLYEFLDTLVPLDAFVVVIIDEAQNMSLPLVEEIRILSDLNGRENQLQVVFVGQLELNAKLKLPEMRQVSQRVSVQCTLEALDRDAVGEYVAHRLRVAGGSPDRVSFAPDSIEAIFLASGGVPRLINRICDRALYQTYLKRAHSVDRATVEAVANEAGQFPSPAVPGPVAIGPPPVVIAEPAQPVALPAAVVAPPARIQAAAPLRFSSSRDALSDQVDVWLARVDVDAPEMAGFAREEPAIAAPVVPVAPVAVVIEVEPRVAAADRYVPDRIAAERAAHWDDVRSHKYVQRMGRRWVRKLRSAVVWVTLWVAVLGGMAVGIPYAAAGLAGVMEPTPLPALPAAPLKVAPVFAPRTPREPVREPLLTAPNAARGYLIEVALFKTRVRAEVLVAALMQAGFTAYQRPFNLGTRGMFQQVLIGQYATRDEAELGLQRLRLRQGHDDARVVASSASDIIP